MKQLLTLLLLATITATAYADKNHKAVAKSTTIKPQLSQQEQTVKPADNPASIDTAWHGTGKETHYEFRQREIDPRTRRYMSVDPSAPPHNSNPYQGVTNNPVKLEK